MPKGIPKAGYRVSRKTGAPLGQGMRAAIAQVTAQVRPVVVVKQETDEEIYEKLTDRFSAVSVMAEATAFGKNRAMILSGPPGLGKSWAVEKIAEKAEAAGRVVVTVKGYIRPTGLYKVLYENRFKKCLVVFDDADSIFADETSLNLLKIACDSTERRRLWWGSETRMEDEDGERLPRTFEFEGSVIFITNYDFDDMIARGSRLAPHFEALISRSHYLDLAMKTKRDYLIRIKQVVGYGMLNETLNKKEQEVLIAFVEKNIDVLRELSLRMVIKLATLMTMNPSGWEKLAKITCMKG